MINIIFVTPENKEFTVTAQISDNLMEVAVAHDIPGIDADCGGGCACATCHILWPESLKNFVQPPEEDEQYLLDFLDNRRINSRLSCQIEVTEDMSGLEVQVPKP